ncbi:MAG: ABC transporter permease [Candidatus Sericytochromatia bacterium]|nr:ABC transporter permease [Candidatus Sericytochromatia bacterium]
MVSTNQKILKRFFKHKLAIMGLAMLAVMYFSILFAEFLAPYGEASADRAKPYASPSRIHFMHQGKFIGPFIYDYKEEFDNTNLTNKKVYNLDMAYPIRFFSHGEPYKLVGLIPSDIHLFTVEAPARMYLWGGDLQGRDVFSRILFGGRVSLTIGIIAIAISYPIGLLMGGIAGYFGGLTDTIIMRLVEAIITFPSLYLLLTLSATLPQGLTSFQRYLLITVILAFIGWAGQARIYRGQVLSLKQMEYVEAARAVGAPHLQIIVKHILPQMSSWIIVSATISIPAYTLGEAALSFLSLGIQDPQASWGLMLQEARNISVLQSKPWLLIPGFAIVISVFAFSFFGDGLRDAFDAKKKI